MRLPWRLLVYAAMCVLLLAWLVPKIVAAPSLPPEPPIVAWPVPVNPIDNGETDYWKARAQHFHDLAYQRRLQLLDVKRALAYSPTVTEAINLACTIYGNCATLWRKARCESHLYRYAANAHSSARGVFQFLTTGGRTGHGTWGTTPFARFSVFSPYANALAAGWMHANGRGGEWVCA